MKSTLAVAALSLLQLAAAQPHGARHHHHNRRDVLVQTAYTTQTGPEVLVIVDQDGNALSTQYFSNTPQTAPAAPPASSAAPVANYVAPAPAAASSSPTSSAAAAPSSSSAAPSAAASSAPASSGGSGGATGHGIAYSPYNADHSCKSADQVKADFDKISGFSVVRLYASDCNQLANVLPVAKAKGLKIVVGVWDITKVSSEISTIVKAVGGSWDLIDTVSIGNEVVNAGTASPSAVVSAIGSAKSALKAAGYSGPVVAVDTFVAILAHPEICQASDYVAANCHPFFDGNVVASDSGKFIEQQVAKLGQACGGKRVVITETGWPTQGDANGKAVPSRDNQQAALSSIKSAQPDNVILFTAFNDLWKTDSGATHNAEKYWGIFQ